MNRRGFFRGLLASALAPFLPAEAKAPAQYANWANYTETYTKISKADLIARMRQASKVMAWNPISAPEEPT